ncbi:hypothetical protein FACS189485_19020 [Spirochaetia bacterium]|nr:hypothetical protein FACS189485_19020 [Spirochaetia bacterium]
MCPPDSFLSVDASAIEIPGTYPLPLNVTLPEGLNLVRHDPFEVSVTVTFDKGADPINGEL